MTDKFHQRYPNATEPKLPIRIYQQLLDRMNADSAFEILTKFEDGNISIDEIKSLYDID